MALKDPNLTLGVQIPHTQPHLSLSSLNPLPFFTEVGRVCSKPYCPNVQVHSEGYRKKTEGELIGCFKK
jgi:hypothetical protein